MLLPDSNLIYRLVKVIYLERNFKEKSSLIKLKLKIFHTILDLCFISVFNRRFSVSVHVLYAN